MDIFLFPDYKAAISAYAVEKKRLLGARFTFERMARSLGVQKTYLSRVLNSEGSHLSQDQLFRAAAFLGLAKDERRYLSLLLERDRTTVEERRRELDEEINATAQTYRRSESHIKVDPTLSIGELADYYLDPDVTLTHMFLAVERFRKDVRTIAAQLGVPPEAMASILQRLERLGMIVADNGGYRLQRETVHLPVDSPVFKPYRAMQRLKAIERCQKLPTDRAYNFSAVFSATQEVKDKIQVLFFALLKEAQTIVSSSPDEDVYQMNFDLFDWSR